MREIKFRTFVKDKGMFYFTIDELLHSTVHSDGVTYSGGDMTYVWKRGEKMQYTGLKDKNGKEIYEGDIIEHTTKRFAVKPITPLQRFQYDEFDGETDDFISMSDVDWKIIGNIYENPKLLDNASLGERK